LAKLPNASRITHTITVDGSDQEVEVTNDYPSVRAGYIRVARSLVDLDALHKAVSGPFPDTRAISRAHGSYGFDAALPGSGLTLPGMSGLDSWRSETNRLLHTAVIDPELKTTLADVVFAVHGDPGRPADTIIVTHCPNDLCPNRIPISGTLFVGRNGGHCPTCGVELYLSDVLRTADEYDPEGTNFASLTRVMSIAERLMTFGFLDFFQRESPGILGATLFVTDGPLALFGAPAAMARPFARFLSNISSTLAENGHSAPLLVGVEKSGRFFDHAQHIRDFIPRGSVMRLTNDYINQRIVSRPVSNIYGEKFFYGRRFFYRTTAGDILVITVPAKSNVAPYSDDPASDSWSSYPTLGHICGTLDSLQTRMYSDAVIPVALAHGSASLPMGIGHSVLTLKAQQDIPGLGVQARAL
ncbi:MAG TPA: hypothetical protein VF867_16070, partial [Arthrobacter sp.]